MANYGKLRWIYLLCHMGFFAAFFVHDVRWWMAAIGTYLFLQIIGVGIGLHRYIAHKSFQTYQPLHYFLLFSATQTLMGSPLSWAAIHRFHHKTSDTELDPHSYHHMGIKKILTGEFNKTSIPSTSIFKDLMKDRSLVWIHHHYYKLVLAWAALLLLFGVKSFLFLFCVPVVLVYWVTLTGIVLNHAFGYRNFETEDKSVNSWVLSVLTVGDGWHNNHHANPTHFSHQVKWWEFDACGYLIRLIRRSKGETR